MRIESNDKTTLSNLIKSAPITWLATLTPFVMYSKYHPNITLFDISDIEIANWCLQVVNEVRGKQNEPRT